MNANQKTVLKMARAVRQAYNDRHLDIGFDRALMTKMVSQELFGRPIMISFRNGKVVSFKELLSTVKKGADIMLTDAGEKEFYSQR